MYSRSCTLHHPLADLFPNSRPRTQHSKRTRPSSGDAARVPLRAGRSRPPAMVGAAVLLFIRARVSVITALSSRMVLLKATSFDTHALHDRPSSFPSRKGAKNPRKPQSPQPGVAGALPSGNSARMSCRPPSCESCFWGFGGLMASGPMSCGSKAITVAPFLKTLEPGPKARLSLLRNPASIFWVHC